MSTQNRSILTSSGHDLQVLEAGNPDGIPVLMHHGTPGSDLLYQEWIEDAEDKGIRLISYNRPGYGVSTTHPGRNVASAAGDVSAIAQALEIKRLLIWGASGGGPQALACAALLPDLVPAVAVMASPAPYPADGLDWFAGISEFDAPAFRAALEGRDAVASLIEGEVSGLLDLDHEGLIEVIRSLASPVDATAFTEDIARFTIDMLREGILDSRDGWIDDCIAFVSPWGFELSQIQVPVMLMHGEQDHFVSSSHGQWIARQISQIDARFLAEDGHVTVGFRIPEIHTWLLSKM